MASPVSPALRYQPEERVYKSEHMTALTNPNVQIFIFTQKSHC